MADHRPLRALLIGGNPGRWKWDDPNPPFPETNGIEAWVFALQGEYRGDLPTASELAAFDLVIANLNFNRLEGLARLAADRPAGVKWVSLVEGAGEAYFEPLPGLPEVLAASDLVATIHTATDSFFRAVSSAPVAWIGIPYPVEGIAKHYVPSEKRRREILVCPRERREPSLLAASALGLPMRIYVPKVSRKLANLKTFAEAGDWSRGLHANALQKRFPNAITPFETDLHPFLAEAAGCALWMNLDTRHTWARFVLDAAALRVPLVTTANTGHGPVLFPETTVATPFAVEEAIRLGRRLLDDPGWAASVSERALAGLDAYRPEACVSRLFSALENPKTRQT